MIYSYQQGDQVYTVDLEQQPDGTYRAVVDGRVYRVEARALRDGAWRLRLDGQAEGKTVYTASQGKERYIKIEGQPAQVLTVPETRAGRRRGSRTAGDGRLVAQMPGQVVDVYVAAGETVTAGQTLVVLEAMKMEIRLSAPAAGVVKLVAIKKGDVVEREQVLIELEQG